jgi:flagellar biosynthesis protein FlhA
MAAALLFILSAVPGLPLLPFVSLGGILAFFGVAIPARLRRAQAAEAAVLAAQEERVRAEARSSIKEQLKPVEIELCFSKELSATLLSQHAEIANRVAKMRRKFAREYGFVVPEIKLTDEINAPAKTYQIRLHGTVGATQELRVHDVLVVVGDGRRPSMPGDEIREPAFGMKALWIPESLASEAKREGFRPIDPISVMLTHLSETIHNNLARLLSYKDMRGLLDRLEPEYKRLLDDICPSQISHSGLLAVFKLLLAERVSIRNLNLILEAIAEIAPHIRRPEQIVEHVRVRIAAQICGSILDQGVLKVLRLGGRWDMVFHQSLKRDAKGEIVEFDIDPRLMEEFATQISAAIRKRLEEKHMFAVVTTAETRPFVRMIIERMFPTLPVLSQLEIARGVDVRSLGVVS